MTKEEIKGLITLTLKVRKKSLFLLNHNLLRFCRLRGKLLKNHSFLYSINFKKSIIPVARLWNYLTDEARGSTEQEYLANLNKLIEQYHYPRFCLSQAYYVNPDTEELKPYPMSKEEQEKWFSIDESLL